MNVVFRNKNRLKHVYFVNVQYIFFQQGRKNHIQGSVLYGFPD